MRLAIKTTLNLNSTVNEKFFWIVSSAVKISSLVTWPTRQSACSKNVVAVSVATLLESILAALRNWPRLRSSRWQRNACWRSKISSASSALIAPQSWSTRCTLRPHKGARSTISADTSYDRRISHAAKYLSTAKRRLTTGLISGSLLGILIHRTTRRTDECFMKSQESASMIKSSMRVIHRMRGKSIKRIYNS